VFFLFALAVLKHIRPLEHVAFNVFGLDVEDTYHMLISAGIAAERAKLIEERLPAAIKALRLR
jgi:hypothetical protein